VCCSPARNWFSQHLLETLVLNDPAARDAALHSIQACVPHAVLLPVAVEQIMTGDLNPGEKLLAQADRRLYGTKALAAAFA
jgi:enediyne polyketide synthase